MMRGQWSLRRRGLWGGRGGPRGSGRAREVRSRPDPYLESSLRVCTLSFTSCVFGGGERWSDRGEDRGTSGRRG